ncbi:hypothetical protein D3C71_1909760 [compost metagenome]
MQLALAVTNNLADGQCRHGNGLVTAFGVNGAGGGDNPAIQGNLATPLIGGLRQRGTQQQIN